MGSIYIYTYIFFSLLNFSIKLIGWPFFFFCTKQIRPRYCILIERNIQTFADNKCVSVHNEFDTFTARTILLNRHIMIGVAINCNWRHGLNSPLNYEVELLCTWQSFGKPVKYVRHDTEHTSEFRPKFDSHSFWMSRSQLNFTSWNLLRSLIANKH